jgi:hypothetical protein
MKKQQQIETKYQIEEENQEDGQRKTKSVVYGESH